MKTLIILNLFVSLAFGLQHKCIWYGSCGPDPTNPTKCLNCYNETEPVMLESSQVYEEKLYQACPHFRYKSDLVFISGFRYWQFFIFIHREDFPDGNPAICCDEGQIDDLLTNFKAAEALLNRCPTCYYNFRINFCDMTCRPDQSKFLKPTQIVEGPFQPCSNNKASPHKGTSLLFQLFFENDSWCVSCCLTVISWIFLDII